MHAFLLPFLPAESVDSRPYRYVFDFAQHHASAVIKNISTRSVVHAIEKGLQLIQLQCRRNLREGKHRGNIDSAVNVFGSLGEKT